MNTTAATPALAGALAARLGELTQLLRREARVGLVSPTLATVLSALGRDGGKRVSELADLAQVAQPTMTSLLRKLSADGIVSRGADPSDHRVVVIELTEAGHDLLGRIRTARTAVLDERLARLTDADRAALAAALPALDTLLTEWRKVVQS